MSILVSEKKCNRCGHIWVPRWSNPERDNPKICPYCKSEYWNTPEISYDRIKFPRHNKRYSPKRKVSCKS